MKACCVGCKEEAGRTDNVHEIAHVDVECGCRTPQCICGKIDGNTGWGDNEENRGWSSYSERAINDSRAGNARTGVEAVAIMIEYIMRFLHIGNTKDALGYLPLL